MNDPEYILVDVMGEKDQEEKLTSGVLYQVQKALGISILNYQYGHIQELNQTLAQWNKTPEDAEKKYPLIWLVQPFTLTRGGRTDIYASVDGGLRLFIMVNTDSTFKAKDRMTQKFKTLIYPIYRELMNQLNNHPAVQLEYSRPHKFTDRYWFEEQQAQLNDIVDCSEVSGLQFSLNNNPNCVPASTATSRSLI